MHLSQQICALGDRPLMIVEGRTFSYADLAREIERVRDLLRRERVEAGEVVALTGLYDFASAACFLALAENKNVAMPLVGADPRDVAVRVSEVCADWVVNAAEIGGETERENGEKRSTLNTQRSTSKEGETEKGKSRLGELNIQRAADKRQGTRDKEHQTTGDIRQQTTTNPQPATARAHPLVAGLRDAGRAGLILFSSGSTGRARAMLHDLDTLIESYPTRVMKGRRVLAFMGLDHIGGIDIFLRGIASGACLVVLRERSPEAICRLIEEARVEVLPATPSFLNLMLLSEAYEGRDLSSLRIIGFGAERMPSAVLGRLRGVFPNVQFQQKFGTSETNAVRTISKESDPLWMRIDDPAVEWKIVEGELWLRTPSRILGYLDGKADRLTVDGWYRTGDLVEEDGEGFFRVAGRVESMINVGGEKVPPGEVEAVILELRDVRDCRVHAVEHPVMGQVVGAEIVLADETDQKEVLRTVRKHCRTRLPLHKVPVKITVVKSIELNARFKRKV